MLKTRLQAARQIADLFLPFERDADRLAATAYATVAAMMTTRAEAGLPINLGADAIASMRLAAEAAAEARQRCFEAHAALSKAIDEAGLRAWYGDTEKDCPQTTGQGATLKAVA